MRKIYWLLFLGLVSLWLPNFAVAQFENGSIVGTVHDATNAVVPGATVTATNINTGIVSTRISNNTGDFEVPALRVGTYTVQISKEGFSPASAPNVNVTIGSRERVDLVLSVGNTATTVDVNARGKSHRDGH